MKGLRRGENVRHLMSFFRCSIFGLTLLRLIYQIWPKRELVHFIDHRGFPRIGYPPGALFYKSPVYGTLKSMEQFFSKGKGPSLHMAAYVRG